jgi:hypothetical protein
MEYVGVCGNPRGKMDLKGKSRALEKIKAASLIVCLLMVCCGACYHIGSSKYAYAYFRRGKAGFRR